MKKRWLALMVLLGMLLVVPVSAAPQPWIEHTIKDTFHEAISVYATDVDGDDDVDILGAAWSDDDITWWENDGSENFTEHTIQGNFDGARSVYATDVDGDDDVDVLGAASNADDITWWKNDPSGNPAPADPITWTEYTIKGDFDSARSVYATDVDGDDDVDVLGAAYPWHIAWWENDGSETFTMHLVDSNFWGAYDVYAADVDGDNDIDVLGAADDGDDITWWENKPSGNPPPADPISWTEHTIEGDFNGARAVYAEDIDGDGHTDVLGAGYYADDITWWENDGTPADGGWTEHTIKGDFDGVRSVYATDVDGDGDTDVLGAAYSADDITWWENKPSGNPPPADPISWTEHTIKGDFNTAHDVYATDVNGDGDTDILGAAYIDDTVTWWEQNHAVSRPNRPTGPSPVEKGKRVCYTTDGSTDSFGHTVQYRFKWGDGTYSGWRFSTKACHRYSKTGTFYVKAQARCSADTSVLSSWSLAKRVKVVVHKVSRPNRPTGPSPGKKGQRLCYTTGGSRDTLGHKVQYRFNWGDGTYSAWRLSTKACHRWRKPGTYYVKAQARCAVKTSVTSRWSLAKRVRITR